MPWVLRQSGDTSDPVLARVYGKQSTKGMLVYFERNGNRTKYILLLSQGGRYGCDGIDKLRYNGHDVARLDAGSEPQWVFHPGTRSTGYNDPLQGRPTFFPNLNLCFSEMCYIEVNLPTDLSPENADDSPDGSEVFMRGLKVMHYNIVSGMLQETAAAYSANNALVSLDLLRECNRMPMSRFQRWAQSWKDFEERCDELISWDKGTIHGGVVSIPRFDAHIVFPQSTPPLTAFNAVLGRAPGAKWQDVNGGIRMLPDLDRDAVHTLRWDPTGDLRANIVKQGLSLSPRLARSLYNFFVYTYRDLEDDQYAEKPIFVDLKELRDSIGGTLVQLGPVSLGVMRQSLAERIGWYIARSTSAWTGDDGKLVFPVQMNVKGQSDSYHVAKCDNVDVAHDLITVRNGAPLFCAVTRETFEPRAAERSFTVQVTARDLYRDTDHTVKQGSGLDFDIATDSLLPDASIDFDYSVTLQPSGGSAPYSWALTSGTLPTGLSLDSATGVISGRVQLADVGSLSVFGVTLTDGAGLTVGKVFDLNIDGSAPPVASTVSLSAFTELAPDLTVIAGIRGSFDFGAFDGAQFATIFMKSADIGASEPSDSEYRSMRDVGPDQSGHGTFELRALKPAQYWIKVRTQSANGVTAPSGHPVTTFTLLPPLQTILKIFDDVPPYQKELGLGLTIGVCAASGVGAWYGARLWRNRGFGYELIASALERQATLGHTDPGHSFLPSSAGTLWFVKEGGADPVNATTDEIALGKNNYFVGREKLGVQTWTSHGGGLWEGTDLVRGLNFTDLFVTDHIAQEDVIQIDENVYFIPLELRDVPQNLSFKPVTYGITDLSTVTPVAYITRGDSIRPYELSNRVGERDGSLDWHLAATNNTRVSDAPASFNFRLRRRSDGLFLRDLPIPANFRIAGMFKQSLIGAHDATITNNNILSDGAKAQTAILGLQKISESGFIVTGKITIPKDNALYSGALPFAGVALLTDSEPDDFSGYAYVQVQWHTTSAFPGPFTSTELEIFGFENVSQALPENDVFYSSTDGEVYFMLALIGTEFRFYLSSSGVPIPGTTPAALKGAFAFAEFPVRLRIMVCGGAKVSDVWLQGINQPHTIYALRQQRADLLTLGESTGVADLGIAIGDLDVEMWEVSKYSQLDNKGFSTRDVF